MDEEAAITLVAGSLSAQFVTDALERALGYTVHLDQNLDDLGEMDPAPVCAIIFVENEEEAANLDLYQKCRAFSASLPIIWVTGDRNYPFAWMEGLSGVSRFDITDNDPNDDQLYGSSRTVGITPPSRTYESETATLMERLASYIARVLLGNGGATSSS